MKHTRIQVINIFDKCIYPEFVFLPVLIDINFWYFQDLKKLYSGCHKITSMLPRYYHLLAYFNILRRRRFLCKLYLKKSSKIAEKHGNQLETDWVKRHQLVWLEKVDLSDHWSDVTDMAHAQWKPREKGTSHLYTWPIVPKTSERSKPMSLHFDTAIK